MRTAMRAAPRLPENNDGSSYLYISLSDPTPNQFVYVSPRARPTLRTRLEVNASSTAASLHSLRRVKRLTHIAPELQARLCRAMADDQTLRSVRSARTLLFQVGDRAQGCAADLS